MATTALLLFQIFHIKLQVFPLSMTFLDYDF